MSRNEELQDKLCAAGLGPRRVRRSPQARRPLLRLEAGKDRPLPFRGEARQAYPAPAADDRDAAQRQGGGLPALPLAARLRPLLRQVPRRRAQGRCLRPDAPDGEGGAGQVRRHAALSRSAKPTPSTTSSRTIEAALYEAVTNYVQTEMGKADQLDGSRKGSVGFALTALQRRLASSPEAIYQSLKRRKERLERPAARGEARRSGAVKSIGRDARRRPRGRRRPERRRAGDPRREPRRSRRRPRRPSPSSKPKSSFSRRSSNRPRPSSPPARIGSGTNSRRSFRTTPRCTTPPAGSGRSSSSPSTATR